MKRRLLLGTGVAATIAACFPMLVATLYGGETRLKDVTGSDLGLIRRYALAAYPIGSSIAATPKDLSDSGFACLFLPHIIENITAPTLTCYSKRHGSMRSPRIVLTLVARDGVLADIVVGGEYDLVEASARTPNPGPAGLALSMDAQPSEDEEWNRMIGSVMWKHPGVATSRRHE